ncbi:MAG: XdhC family protein [Anaerolineae bacterium]|nr:XdhC family protein [Anaerolineae bacterium]
MIYCPESNAGDKQTNPWLIATVAQVYGSALRPSGSKMTISAAGDIAGLW